MTEKERVLRAVEDTDNEAKATEEKVTEPEPEFAFIISKDKQGNIGIKTVDNVVLPIEEVYHACDAICRNIQTQATTQSVSQAVAERILQALQGAGKSESGLILPPNQRKN